MPPTESSFGVTRALGAFVANLRFADVPQAAHAAIHTGFADCIGVMIAGGQEPATRLLTKTLAPAPGAATLFFSAATAAAPEAAWINGTAAHALDFDDVAQRGHPSAVLVPAILAEAQTLRANGERMLTAYAAGYEAWAELIRREPDQHHAKGWHPTAIFGAIAAAAAVASLRQLDAERCAVALALGASQSAGLMANFGTMTKPFHAGRSAHAGLIAARLAEAGFSAALDALEHPQGFLSAVSPRGLVDRQRAVQAGREWRLPIDRVSVKKYPLCYCTHRALDGMLDLLVREVIDGALISRITVVTSQRNATVLRNHRPRTGLEAKFSMEFAMACAVVARRAGLTELTDEFVNRSDVQALIQRTHVSPDPHEDPNKSGYALHDRVTIELDDGRIVDSGPITDVRGDAANPLTTQELQAKFEDCLRAVDSRVPATALFETLMALPSLSDANLLPGLR